MSVQDTRPDELTGSEWQVRYRVLGRSAVWPDMFVCELLTGPDKGEYVIMDEGKFAGRRAAEGEYRNGMAMVGGAA